jgi:hypothetical protein
MRIDFISRLALLLIAGFLVVATQVWGMGTVEWLFIVGGIVMIALAAGSLGERGATPQRAVDAVLALLGVWAIVEAIVFSGDTLKWFSFATALAAAALAVVGLAIHEATTERVVHELSVSSAPDALRHAGV